MNGVLLRRIAICATALAAVWGCTSVVDHIAGESSADGGGTLGGSITGGFTDTGGDFTDSPTSPGGTGGIDTTPDQPDLPDDAGEATRSFFTAYQIDPEQEDTAGPKFVVSGDVNQDGLPDLVSGWNQSQPVQLHLQQRDENNNISFRTVTLAGTSPVAVISGVELGELNGDGWLDVVVLAKASGALTLCPPEFTLCMNDSGFEDDRLCNNCSPATPCNADRDCNDCPPLASCSTDRDCNPECNTDPPGQPCTIAVQCGTVTPGVCADDCEINVTCGTIQPGVCDDCEIEDFCGTARRGICDGFDEPSDLSVLDSQIIVYFSPGNAGEIPDGDAWDEMILVNPLVSDPAGNHWHNQFAGREDFSVEESQTKPELSGFAALAVADIDGQNGDDILVSLNPAECENLCQEPPTNSVDLWLNPGPAFSEIAALWGTPMTPPWPAPLVSPIYVPLTLMADAPAVKDIVVMDVDGDTDLDVVATFTNALSLNIRWARNPLVPHSLDGPGGPAEVNAGVGGYCYFFATGWESLPIPRPIGQVDTAADVLTTGDIDADGFDDIVVRSTAGQIVQWFRRPNALAVEPEFPPSDPVPDRFNFPWPVFTLTELDQQEPEAIAVGDLTGNGLMEVMVAAEGAVSWYEPEGDSIFDPWVPSSIIQDGPAESTDAGTGGGTIGGAGVGVSAIDVSTVINTLLVIDLDGDGKNDIIGTLDRRSGSGLSDDRLVWYRNTRTDD